MILNIKPRANIKNCKWGATQSPVITSFSASRAERISVRAKAPAGEGIEPTERSAQKAKLSELRRNPRQPRGLRRNPRDEHASKKANCFRLQSKQTDLRFFASVSGGVSCEAQFMHFFCPK